MSVIVAQKGAREHFLAARALHQRRQLAALLVDWYAPRSHSARKLLNLLGQRRAASALAARCDEIPAGMVHAFPLRSLLWKWREKRGAATGRSHEAYVETDAAFARAVAQVHLPAHDVFFGYSYASLEMLQAEKKRGSLTVLDQIDPGPAEFRLVAEEMLRHPEVAGNPGPFPSVYYDRVRREWELADVLVVNSEWTRELMIQEGADPSKIEVLPLAYEPEATLPFAPHPPAAPSDTLRVLWLGQVNVRKGIHYLIEAARLLKGEKMHFDIVGPLGILPGAVAAAPTNMTFHGPVSRDLAAEWYRGADIFVLPTLSDGFALTQLESMAHGLPVIATHNCGRVVEDGKTGSIIPARDSQALAQALLAFVRNRALAPGMSPQCRKAASAYSVEAYGERLVEIILRRKNEA